MILLFLLLILCMVLVRVWWVLASNGSKRLRRHGPAKTLIVLGSGGHTAEMMQIVGRLSSHHYQPRYYVLANSDTTSRDKIKIADSTAYTVLEIHRSRQVKQSYVTSLATTLYSTLQCIPLLIRIQPDLILCNGPGTCVPLCAIAFIMKLAFINQACKIVFVESYCRVQSLSLSGKLLLPIVNEFIVHWPDLKRFSAKIKCFGRLI